MPTGFTLIPTQYGDYERMGTKTIRGWDMPLPDDVPLVIEPDKEYLNRRQLEDYRQHRQEVLEWLWTVGKDSERNDGYSKSVTRNMAYRLSKIYRWVWDREDRYTTEITHEDADAYLREIAGMDWKNSNKSQYRW